MEAEKKGLLVRHSLSGCAWGVHGAGARQLAIFSLSLCTLCTNCGVHTPPHRVCTVHALSVCKACSFRPPRSLRAARAAASARLSTSAASALPTPRCPPGVRPFVFLRAGDPLYGNSASAFCSATLTVTWTLRSPCAPGERAGAGRQQGRADIDVAEPGRDVQRRVARALLGRVGIPAGGARRCHVLRRCCACRELRQEGLARLCASAGGPCTLPRRAACGAQPLQVATDALLRLRDCFRHHLHHTVPVDVCTWAGCFVLQGRPLCRRSG